MEKIKRYQDFIAVNEVVKNFQSTRFLLNKMFKEIQSKVEHKLSRDNIRTSTDNAVYIQLNVMGIEESDLNIIEKIFKQYKMIFAKNDLILSYKQSRSYKIIDIDANLNIKHSSEIVYNYLIYVKNTHTKRAAPKKFIYHYSDKKNTASILANGLKINNHQNSDIWKGDIYLEYPDALFAVNHESDVWYNSKYDRFKIDTTKIKNTWWEDLNFNKRPDFIMTFTDIPANAISLDNI